MEGELQDDGKLDQDLEQWLYSIGIQPNIGFFYEEEKQEYTRIEGLDQYGATIINKYPGREKYTMMVVKWSDKVEGLEDSKGIIFVII